MQDVPSLSPLLQYEPAPLWIALGFGALLGLLYFVIFWLTRRKPQKTLQTLAPAPPVTVDLNALKQQYLHDIDRVDKAYRSRELKARYAHQALSRLLKAFVTEAVHMPVKTMTLADLKKTRHQTLAAAIEASYEPEFAAIESGSVEKAVQTARKVVSEWS